MGSWCLGGTKRRRTGWEVGFLWKEYAGDLMNHPVTNKVVMDCDSRFFFQAHVPLSDLVFCLLADGVCLEVPDIVNHTWSDVAICPTWYRVEHVELVAALQIRKCDLVAKNVRHEDVNPDGFSFFAQDKVLQFVIGFDIDASEVFVNRWIPVINHISGLLLQDTYHGSIVRSEHAIFSAWRFLVRPRMLVMLAVVLPVMLNDWNRD